MTRKRASVLLVVAALIGIACYGFWYIRTPFVIRELPTTANDVHWLSRDLFPDSSFSMSAALSMGECQAYVTDIFSDLEPLDPTTLRATLGEESAWGLSWGLNSADPERPWWQPHPVDEAATWYRNNGGAWELVQCTGEHVFYERFSH